MGLFSKDKPTTETTHPTVADIPEGSFPEGAIDVGNITIVAASGGTGQWFLVRFVGVVLKKHLDRPEEAIPHWDRYLELAPNHHQAKKTRKALRKLRGK